MNDEFRTILEMQNAEKLAEQSSQLAQKANKTQEAWIAPTLLNSWVNYGGGSYDDAGYFLDDFGFVNLRGVIKDGVTTAGTVLFTLPSGYRPSLPKLSLVYAGTSVAYIDVLTSGNVRIRAGSNTLFSLYGVRFKI